MTEADAPLQLALSPLFTENEIRNGSAIVVVVEQSHQGAPRLRKEAAYEDIPSAIRRAIGLSQQEPGVVVASFAGGPPLILCRFGVV